jgi:Xaa-Pro dipeptidase
VKILKRVEVLRRLAFEKRGFDGFLIANEANLLYFTGFPGATCLLIPKNGESTIYVYGTNYEQAKAEGRGFNVELVKRGEKLMEKIAAQVKDFKIQKLAVDMLSFENYRNLAKGLRGETKLKAQNKLVWELRKVKDEKELELVRKAGELTSEGMKAACETIKPGIREYEVAAEIEYAMRRKGSWGTAFETIVASGVRSAFPHGGCTERKIQKGDLVVVDIGAAYQHYRSDMTRTIVAGKPSVKQKKIYEIVRLAQEKAFQAVKPKARARDIDAVARKVIDDAGYGEYFVHGLGHGVGLEIHEPPTLSQESKDRLTTGNVVTIEPGIYLVGFGGIRIEDTVLVRRRKAEKFTKGPYALEAEW